MNHLYNYNIHMLLSFSEISMRQLQLFTTVAETESFSRAASILGVSQSLISKNIADLEKVIGNELVVRNRQGTTLTQSGKVMYREASALLRQIHNAERLVRRFDTENNLDGTLEIGYEMMFPRSLVTQAVLRFKLETPNVTIHLHKSTYPGIADMLNANKVDIGLVLSAPTDLSEMHISAEPIGSDVLSVVSHRALMPENELNYHVGLVNCLPTMLINSDGRGINSTMRVCRDLDAAPDFFFCSDVEEILTQVEAGGCVSFLPEKIIREFCSPYLCSFPLTELDDAKITLIAAQPKESQTVLTSRFIQILKSVARELDPESTNFTDR